VSSSEAQPKQTWAQWFSRTVWDVCVSVIAAAAVSALFLYYFEVRLENSKNRVATLMASEERFDAAHNDVVVQFGIYSNELFVRNDSGQKAKFLDAVITTQLELLDLRQHMGDKDIPALSKYADVLAKLRDEIRPVNNQRDLGPALRTVQNLLAAHKNVTDTVETKTKISFLD
jgi:hypothetical protein